MPEYSEEWHYNDKRERVAGAPKAEERPPERARNVKKKKK